MFLFSLSNKVLYYENRFIHKIKKLWSLGFLEWIEFLWDFPFYAINETGAIRNLILIKKVLYAIYDIDKIKIIKFLLIKWSEMMSLESKTFMEKKILPT